MIRSASRPPAVATDAPADGEPRPAAGKEWRLRLYVAGRSPRSGAARANLERLCETHVPGRYEIEIVDLVCEPGLARADQVLAVPTLVRLAPAPVRRLIGDLSDEARALVFLEVPARPPVP